MRSRGVTADRRSKRLQASLVVAQVALAFVLVAGAALLGRSLARLQAVPLGYDLEQVLTFQVRLPDAGYADRAARRAYLRDLRAALAASAGVREVGATTYLPQQTALPSGARVGAPGMDEVDMPFAAWVRVDRGYFRAIGIPVLQGQPFAEPGENSDGLDRLVINAALAQRLFPDGGPVVGRTVTLQGGGSLEARIEAVVGDVHMDGHRRGARPIIYTDMDIAPSAILGLAVRAEGDAARLSEQVRAVAAAVDPKVAPFNLQTTASAAARQIAVESAVARLSSIFGISALILAALGLYGLVSQGIEQRRRELGIRLALGAHPARLLRRAMAPPLLLTTMGLGVGLAVTFAVAERLAPLLFEVSARDPLVLGGVVVAVIGVATLASLISGRSALGVDPVESLRSE
jgi:predicted permease